MSTAEQKLPVEPENLETLRDQRVLPVVRGVLSDIAEAMPSTDITPNTDFTTLLIKVLQRSLDADLNLTTENPYVFGQVLSVFSAFNTVVQKSKMADAPDERFARIAGQMMRFMASVDVPLGRDVKPEEQEAAMMVLQPEFEALFARENLTSLEVTYILEGIMRALKMTEQLFSGNVARSVSKMEAKILNIDDMTDLTMKKLDETLRVDIAEFQKEKEERQNKE